MCPHENFPHMESTSINFWLNQNYIRLQKTLLLLFHHAYQLYLHIAHKRYKL